MNKTAKKILYIGISLIIIALLLLIYFEWEEIYSKKESNDIMKTILNNKDNNKNEDEIVIDDLKYIGYIVIPTLDLNLPISKEFSYSSLKKSPTLEAARRNTLSAETVIHSPTNNKINKKICFFIRNHLSNFHTHLPIL